MKKNLFLGTIFVLLLTNCGFKVIDNKKLYNFDIVKVNSTGDSKIAFILKNNLEAKNNKKEKKVKLDIKIKKEKSIKEKNIKNQITKYKITIALDISYILDSSSKRGTFNLNKFGVYDVTEQYSQTINNENNLINLLSKNLIEEIKINLSEITNDL